MKKLIVTMAVLTLIAGLVATAGCGKKSFAGSKAAALIPVEAKGVVLVNIQQLSQTKLFDEMMKKTESPAPQATDEQKKLFKDFEDFVQSTGIDPKKDLLAVAVGIMEFKKKEAGKSDPNIVAVINLNYDRKKITDLLASKGLTPQDYNGASLFSKEGEKGVFALINDSIAAASDTPELVKKVVDLAAGKGSSIIDHPVLKKYISQFKADNLLSLAIEFPQEMKKVEQTPMMKVDLTKAEAFTGYAAYRNGNWSMEFSLINPTKDNIQMATALNGFKGMAGMLGPDVAEAVQQINVVGDDEKLGLTVNLSDALIEKLEKTFKKKMAPTAPPEGDMTQPAEPIPGADSTDNSEPQQ